MQDSPRVGVKPGTKLSAEQATALDEDLATILDAVRRRRRGLFLIHDSLQNAIGLFLQLANYQVGYKVPFVRGGWAGERKAFDIAGTSGEETFVVGVKETVGARDLGQIWGYIKTLKLSHDKAKVYLGTDILNFGRLQTGSIGAMVQELMEKENMGVLLADKYVLIGCENYAQLTLQEMPVILTSEEPVG